MMQKVNRPPTTTTLGTIHVEVPTATAIVRDREDPFRILLGWSTKHATFVLPGGKIDTHDAQSTTMRGGAEECIRRELFEEIGVSAAEISCLAVTSHPERDVRTVPARALAESLAGAALKHAPPETPVTAHYGVPDYLFVATITPDEVTPSAELSVIRWVDCRNIESLEIGAGHAALIEIYLEREGATS